MLLTDEEEDFFFDGESPGTEVTQITICWPMWSAALLNILSPSPGRPRCIPENLLIVIESMETSL